MFHYNCIENRFGNKSRVLLTDTDSLMYKMKTEDISGDFSPNKEIFDFDNCSPKSKPYDNSNTLVAGKTKHLAYLSKNLLD